MKTLLLSARYTPDSTRMWRAALDAGWRSERVSLRDAASWPADAPVDAVYGELLFVEALLGARPDLRLLGPAPDWLLGLPPRFLGRSVAIERLSRARARTAPVFVKPTLSKQFPARVYDPGREIVAAEIDGDPEVLVSQPVTFLVEARTFVDPAAGIATSSVYERDGTLDPSPPGELEGPIREIVGALAEGGWIPVPMVVDVGLLDSGEWVVVEANEAWGAGLYACDPDVAFRVVAATLARA